MQFKRIHVTINGNPPGLLMNYHNIDDAESEQSVKKKTYIREEEAAKAAYMAEIDGKRQLYIPGLNVYTMMVQACSGFKIPNPQGGRKISLRGIMAGIMRIVPDKIPLGTDEYEIDSRYVRIGTARVVHHRPNLPEWKASFDIVYDADWITNPNIFKEVLDEAGFRYGILDYRPQHGGPFGTFTVTEFESEE